MKNFFCGILLFFTALAFCNAEGISEEARKGNEKADMSYAFGMVVASDLAGTGLQFNYDTFIMGLREVMEKKDTRYTQDEAMSMIQTAYANAQAEISEKNWAEGSAFLAENGKRPEVVTTNSGLQYEDIVEGAGESPGPDDTVLVNYKGTTLDGHVFDSTYESGQPMKIPLNRVIPGWSEGLQLMKEGGKAKLYLPPGIAYGDNGSGGVIGPNAVLIFEVELVSVVKPDQNDSGNAADNSAAPPDNSADNSALPGISDPAANTP